MTKILKAANWNKLRDIRPEPEAPEPSQPKAPVPNHVVAVTAQGTRPMRPVVTR